MIVEKAARRDEAKWDVTKLLTDLNVQYDVEGQPDRTFSHVAALSEATSTDLSFCSGDGEEAVEAILNSGGGIILCKKQLRGLVQPRNGAQLVYLDNPRRAFVRVVNELKRKIRPENSWSHPVIAPNAVVSASAKIGMNCEIGNFAVIGENCIIGDNCRIHDRVTIGPNTRIGNNCTIQSGVTMGEDGFSYERYESAELEKFPHFGAVVIGDNVEIAANTNIARGSLSDTVISSGTKIDAMVHIAHNVRVGTNCQLTGGTIIGGSAVIGDSCWTGLNSTIKDHARLGNNVIVAAGACVIHDVPDGDIVAGVPAKSIKQKVSDPNVFLMAGQKRSESG